MNLLEAIVLGVIQGLTEFLPISSTAHLTLAGRSMGLIDPARPQDWTAFIAVIQAGTLLAVLTYFAKDLLDMARGLVLVARRRANDADRQNAKLAGLVVLGTLPIVVVGLALRDLIEGPFTKNLWVIAAGLVALALVLLVAERVGAQRKGIQDLGAMDALAVGLWQTLSLVPGSSRAGTTLTGGLFRGLQRETAARFSFLLSIPAIAGSAVFQAPMLLQAHAFDAAEVVVAVVASAASGYLAIAMMLAFVRRSPTYVFVGYRIVLGGIIAALLLGGVVQAN